MDPSGCQGLEPPTWRCAAVIARWRLRVARRSLGERLLRTWEGRLTLVVLALALPALLGPWLHGRISETATGPTAQDLGTWILGMGSGMVCLAFLVPSVLARVLVLDAPSDPLRLNPPALPVGAGVTGAGLVWATAVYALGFSTLFHGRPLLAFGASPFTGVALATLSLGAMVCVGALVAEGSRVVIRGDDPADRAERIRRTCSLPFFASFIGLPWVSGLADRLLPGGAGRIGIAIETVADSPGLAPWPPMILGSILVLTLPVGLAQRWCSRGIEDLGLVGSRNRPLSPSTGGGIPRVASGFLGQARLLRAKDLRTEPRFDRIALPIAAGIIGSVLLAAGAADSVAVLVVSAVAACPGLSWMGTEGRRLGPLVVRLGMDRLYAIRTVVSVARAMTLAAGGIGIVVFFLAFWGAPERIRPIIAIGVLGTVSLSILAAAIGAVFPAQHPRTGPMSGASRTGVACYLFASAVMVGFAQAAPEMGVSGLIFGLAATTAAWVFGRIASRRHAHEWRP